MKPKNSTKGVSNYPFLFLGKKHQRNKFESAYSDKPQLAESGTNHTITTPNGRVLHRKPFSKPFIDFNQQHSTRGIGLRRPNGQFIKSPLKLKQAMVIESESDTETPLMDVESPKTPEPLHNTTFKKSTFR